MKIDFCHPDISDINSLKKLWLCCFEENPLAADLFFDRCFSVKTAYVAKFNNKIVSALYLINTLINGQQAHYLCGASTHPNFQKRGIMSRLIEFALADSAKKGDKLSFLYPASDSLYSYYSKLGYRAEYSAYVSSFNKEELISLGEINGIYDNVLIWNDDFKRFASQYYAVYNVNSVYNENYFALFTEKNGIADVLYFDFKENYFQSLVNEIIDKTSAEKFVLTHNNIFKNSKRIRSGMVKPLNSEASALKDVYIGITLS